MTFPGSASPKVRFVAAAAAFATLYFLAAELTSSLAGDAGIAVLWPASGVYLGVMLVAPRGLWPALALGAALGSLAAYSHAGSSLELSVAFAVPSSAEGLLGAVLVERIVRGRFRLGGLRDVSALVVGSIIATALVALSAGAVAAQTFSASFAESWLRWWSADAVGVLAVAPLVIALAHAARERPSRAELRYAAGVIALVGIAALSKPSATAAMVGGALALPLLLWAGWRWGARAAALGSAGIALAAMHLASGGSGLLGDAGGGAEVHILQAFLAALLLSALAFAAAVADWRQESTVAARSRRRLRQLMDSSTDAYLAVDAQGRIADWSASAEAMFGWAASEAVGRSIDERVARGAGPATPTAEGQELTLRARHRTGQHFPAAVTIRAGTEADDGLCHVFVRDLTQSERLDRQLRRANEELERRSQARDEARSELRGTSEELSRAGRRIEQLTADLAARESELREVKSTLTATKQELDTVSREHAAAASGRDRARSDAERARSEAQQARTEGDRVAREGDRLRADLARVTGELTRVREELSTSAAELARAKAEGRALGQKLDSTSADHTRARENAESERAAHARTAEELESTRAEYTRIADELESTRAEYARIAEELVRVRATHARTAEELECERAAHTRTADELESARAEHAQTEEELAPVRAEHARVADELQRIRAEHARAEAARLLAEHAVEEARARFADERARLERSVEEATAALAGAEAERRLLGEHGTELISRYDDRGVCLYASPAARSLLGYEPEELVGRPGAELIHPDDRPRLLRARAAGSETTFEARLQRKTRDHIRVEVTFRPTAGREGGRLGEVTTIVRPVAAAPADDESRRVAETRFHSLFGTLPTATALVGNDGRIRRANLALSRLTGYSRDQLEGTALETLVDDQQATIFKSRMRQVASGHVATLRLDQQLGHANGRSVPVELIVTPLPAASAETNGGSRLHELVVHFEDVSDRAGAYAA